MDVATMVAINNLNMVTVMAVQAAIKSREA